MGLVAHWTTRLTVSIEQRGTWGTVRRAFGWPGRAVRRRWVLWRLHNPWRRFLDRQFDRRHGVDTAGVIDLPQLTSDPRFRYAHNYGPTHAGTFLRLLRQLDIDHRRFVFVDFGCGKGKALLLAASLPFKRVVGVELAPELVAAAERNVQRWTARAGHTGVFELACVDAAEYPIPADPAVLYFFNPFMAEAMRAVLENIRRSLEAVPREIYVIYQYPLLGPLFDECGFLRPVRRTSLYAIYKSSA